MQIRVIVIDDEHKSRQNLVNLLEQYCQEVAVLATAGSAIDGLKAIREHDPDLVFIDVEMPLGTGFDLLSHAKPINFGIVFVTGYDEYAAQAFDYNALHYIRKPIHPLKLQEAISRYKARHAASIESVQQEPSSLSGQIVMHTQMGSDVIRVEDIIKFKANGSYTEVFMADGARNTYSVNLREVQERLNPADFHRVHHSWVVNRKHIRKYVRGKGGYLILSDESVVDVSARRKKNFIEWLEGQ